MTVLNGHGTFEKSRHEINEYVKFAKTTRLVLDMVWFGAARRWPAIALCGRLVLMARQKVNPLEDEHNMTRLVGEMLAEALHQIHEHPERNLNDIFPVSLEEMKAIIASQPPIHINLSEPSSPNPKTFHMKPTIVKIQGPSVSSEPSSEEPSKKEGNET